MKKWLVWGIPAVVLVALVGWRFSAKNAANAAVAKGQKARSGAAASVEIATAGPRTIIQSIQSVGNVSSPYKVEISPKTTGKIIYLEVREGDPVKQGQVVLKIDPSDLQGAMLQAEAGVADAKYKLAQATTTKGSTNAGILNQIRQQQAGVTSAEADYTQVKNNFEANVQQAQAQVDAASFNVKNMQANLTKEQANLANAQSKYNRTLDIYQKGFIAAQDLDDAKAALDVEKAAVKVDQALIDSAKSQLNAQQQNLSIVKKKGTSDIADAKAKLDQAKATLDTAKANTAQSPAYQQQLDALKEEVKSAEGNLDQARARLSDTSITSSVNGTVTARKADPGALASPGSPVLEVSFLDWLYVTATLPIETISKVHVGQQVQMTFDSMPGQTFEGPITNVNPVGDPQSRAYGIMIRLDNKDHRLHPGMFGQVTVLTGKIDAPVVVPNEAIHTDSGGVTTVTVVDSNNVAHITTVKLGVKDDKGAQVTEGVNASDKVVVLSYTLVKDGGKVSFGKPGGANGPGAPQGKGSGRGKRQQQAQ